MIEELIDKTQIAINEYLKSIKREVNNKAYLNVVEEYFNKIYRYVEENIDDIDSNTLARIHGLENSLHNFIISFTPDMDAPNEVADGEEYLLKTIVYFTRKQLVKNESVDFSSDSLRKYDEEANKYVKDMCDRLGLLCISFNISDVFGIPKKHNVSLVKVDDNYYLVDCTYQQYFLQGQNFRKRYLKSASHIVTCEVGSRILYRNHGGALELLEKGFIRSDDEIFGDYFSTMFTQYAKPVLTKNECLEWILKNRRK